MKLRSNVDYFLILESNQVLSLTNSEPTYLNRLQIHHYRTVLRLTGKIIAYIGDGNGLITLAEIDEANLIIVEAPFLLFPQSPIKKSFLIAPIKNNNLEIMIQKATELGIHSFHFIESEYTSNLYPKLNRLKEIAFNACRQSINPYLPNFHLTKYTLKQYPFEKDILYIWGDRCASKTVHDIIKEIKIHDKKEIVFINGPEGGWSNTEKLFLSERFPVITLSNNILRAETAAICMAYHLNII